jgi:pyruvate/2-oxoglutarate dehydrogenase complex dihydrolipoamide dehydrogenase (E3) component
VRAIEPHDSVERYTGARVDVVPGRPAARPVDGRDPKPTAACRRLTTKSIVIATGAAPFVPPLPGLDEVGCLTSDTLWGLRELPRRLVVLGGGPIGCELAQAFAAARLGGDADRDAAAPAGRARTRRCRPSRARRSKPTA